MAWGSAKKTILKFRQFAFWAELELILWILIKGVTVEKWNKLALTSELSELWGVVKRG